MNISKSLIGAFEEVEMQKRCGLQFLATNIMKTLKLPTSDAANKGKYFEYLVTGAKNRDGSIPEPETIQSGKLNADYQRITEHAEYCKKMLKAKKIEIIEIDKTLESKYKNTNIKGVLDILGNYKDKETIFDLKMSGLIGNKWEKWGWHEDTVIQYQKIQPRIYKWLAWKIFKIVNIPFYYLIFSPKKLDVLLWNMNYRSEEMFFEDMKELEGKFTYVNSMINYYNTTGWEATNDFQNCLGCVNDKEEFHKCKHRLFYPKEEEFFIQ